MAVAQLAEIAHDFGIAESPVRLLGITLPAITFALSIDRILNGITRPTFGWISDHLGRENTMFVAFALEALGIWALSRFGSNPVAFVLLSGTVFLFWGEIFSLFPATVGDVFGARYATTNTGMMYTAKGTASLLVPLGAALVAATGSWQSIFLVSILLNVFASVCAMFVLKPMLRRRTRALSEQPQVLVAADAK
jgi:OFA family oxalate/formate antiporter-like MFS transporter